jgi:hypothetical protein
MSAADRLTTARAGKAKALREIAAAQQRRLEHLRCGDDAAAAAADYDLGELRLTLKRREDEIELLPSLISVEGQEARLPSDPAKAKALLAEKERRYLALRARNKNDLSAVDQMELDSFPIASGQLQQHIALIEGMQNA